ALRDRLLNAVAQRRELREPLSEFVVADYGLRMLLEQLLLRRCPLVLRGLRRLDHARAGRRVEILQALVEELFAKRVGERRQSVLRSLHLLVDELILSRGRR